MSAGGRIALAACVAGLGLLARPAGVMAAPPTVVPSPGYELRLQESRRARSAEHSYRTPFYQYAPPVAAPRWHRAPERWRSGPRRLY